MYGGYHEISKGAYPRFGLEGWTEEGWPRHPPSFSPWKLACVWPPQARKHACGARNGGRRQQGEGGAHTCLHVLIPFSFWGLPRLPTPSPPPVTRPTLSPLLLACLRYSSGRANLASFTYAAAAFPPGPMPFSPSTLDTSRDLNSFYFPYISRSTTPSCCHPPASSTSLPTASLHPAPPLVGPRTTLRPRTEASSDVTFIPPFPSYRPLFPLRRRAALLSFIPYPTLLLTCVLYAGGACVSHRVILPTPAVGLETSVSVREKILLIAEESLR